MVIEYVGANAGRAAVDSILDPRISVRWQQVDRSRAELDEIAASIKDSHLDGVVMIGIDTIHNQVEVTVSPSDKVGQVSALVGSLYHDGIVVDATNDPLIALTCSNRNSCTPWRGGIKISNYDAYPGLIDDCTWGFQASRNGNLQMITAGHCGSVGNTIKHNGEAIGNLNFNAINPSTFKGVDVARIRVTGADYPHVQNTLYATDSYKLWSLTSVSATRDFYVGQGVGKSGVHGYASGSITDTHVYYQLIPADGDPPLLYYPNCTFYTRTTCPWMSGVETNLPGMPGDSGGPVYSTVNFSPPMGVSLFGIISVGSDTSMAFAPADEDAIALDVDFWCTTAGCP